MFEIKNQRGEALFHVKIPREVSASEAQDLVQLAMNIIAIAEPIQTNTERVFGPLPPPGDPNYSAIDNVNTTTSSSIYQAKLGSRPIDKINMMGYVEPSSGVRIKMLAFPGADVKVKAVKAFRLHTGISLMGCKEIIWGNYPCPILNSDVADKIIEEFRKLEVYAKIVPGNLSEAA